jgi:hypothetical protein
MTIELTILAAQTDKAALGTNSFAFLSGISSYAIYNAASPPPKKIVPFKTIALCQLVSFCVIMADNFADKIAQQ